jgi:hypothetical protein
MNSNVIPTFSKVEILVKKQSNNTQLPSVTKLEFFDSGLMITGNYLVITSKEYGDTLEYVNQTSSVFNLNDISAYKTYSEPKYKR